MNMGTLCFGVEATVGSTMDAERLTLFVAGLKVGRPPIIDVLGVLAAGAAGALDLFTLPDPAGTAWPSQLGHRVSIVSAPQALH